MTNPLHVTTDTGTYSQVQVRYLELVREQNLLHHSYDSWPTLSKASEVFGELAQESLFGRNENDHILLYERDLVIYFAFQRQTVNVYVSGSSVALAKEGMKKARELVSRDEVEPQDDQIGVNFWYQTNDGPNNIWRRIEAPNWDVIQQNYPENVRDDLTKLMLAKEWEPRAGQLLLWHGIPGTGKTYAIRALAQAWKSWATIHYVTDPEQFFGQGAYLMQVMLTDTEEVYDDELEEWQAGKKWKLIVLEDAGELLTQDAKKNVGQSLQRLLNVADGMIGQGLRVLVLVTTNERITSFHKAVVRPGRAASQILFDKLDREEAGKWLSEKDSNFDDKAPVGASMSLAELYATVEDRKLSNQKQEIIGFAHQ